MGQVDIRRLFEILYECQELAPEIARRILGRILEILREWKDECGETCFEMTNECGETCFETTEERGDGNHEM